MIISDHFLRDLRLIAQFLTSTFLLWYYYHLHSNYKLFPIITCRFCNLGKRCILIFTLVHSIPIQYQWFVWFTIYLFSTSDLFFSYLCPWLFIWRHKSGAYVLLSSIYIQLETSQWLMRQTNIWLLPHGPNLYHKWFQWGSKDKNRLTKNSVEIFLITPPPPLSILVLYMQRLMFRDHLELDWAKTYF